MIKHYFKVAWRNLNRQKLTTFINISGLSVGIACFILFLLYSLNELNFDRFHKNKESIYAVYELSKGMDGTTEYTASVAMPLGPTMKKDMPDVLNYVRLRQPREESFVQIDKEVKEVKLLYADPQLFSVFSFSFKYGNAVSALHDLNSIVFTSSKAQELFGTDNIIGKTVQVKIDTSFQTFIVSAVADDPPANSSIRFDAVGSFSFLETTRIGTMLNNWYTTSFRTYVQLRPGSSLPRDIARLTRFHQSYNPDDDGITKKTKSLVTYGLLPLSEIHTNAFIENISVVETVSPKTIWIILSIAVAILLIACINFTTLAIGHASGKSKEVGVRKVIGAQRNQLASQFFSEAFLLSVLSTVTGLVLAKLLLPYFNELSGRNLTLSPALYPELVGLLIAMTIIVALLSGSYPAFLLSRFRPMEVFRNEIKLGGSNLFTKSLVTLQFTLSIGLIAATAIILQQTKYMKAKNPGFNKENIVMIDASQIDAKKNYPLFRQALLSQSSVIGVTASETGLGEGAEFQDHGFMYKDTHKSVHEYLIDPDYINVLGMQLVAGRNFDASIADDTSTSVIINEAMMNDFGWTIKDVLGQQIKGYTNSKTPVIIGVVKNFNFRSFTEKIQPQLFHQFPGHRIRKFFIRLTPGNPAPMLSALNKTWSTIITDAPFKYSFLDESLDNFYKAEKRWSGIVGWAGGISIFLACIGLLGLTVLTAINRTKEIGIRKILGASVLSIVGLLSRDFIKLILIALVIAAPIAWYFMKQWLQGFAYRIDMGWIVFVATGLFAIGIAMLTISFYAVRAGRANPAKSLRTE